MLIVGYCSRTASSGGYARKLNYIWPTGGSAGSISMIRYPTIRPSRSIATVASAEDGDILRQVFEAVVHTCMDAGFMVKGEGFAVDASVMEADASRYHRRAPMRSTGLYQNARPARLPSS